jgi:hypothetical protein
MRLKLVGLVNKQPASNCCQIDPENDRIRLKNSVLLKA